MQIIKVQNSNFTQQGTRDDSTSSLAVHSCYSHFSDGEDGENKTLCNKNTVHDNELGGNSKYSNVAVYVQLDGTDLDGSSGSFGSEEWFRLDTKLAGIDSTSSLAVNLCHNSLGEEDDEHENTNQTTHDNGLDGSSKYSTDPTCLQLDGTDLDDSGLESRSDEGFHASTEALSQDNTCTFKGYAHNNSHNDSSYTIRPG